MAAKIEDFYIEKNATFKRILTFSDASNQPINLDGFSFSGAIAKTAKEEAHLVSFSFEIVNPTTLGKVIMKITDEDTGELPATGSDYSKTSKYTYFVDATDSLGDTNRILNGFVNVSPRGPA